MPPIACRDTQAVSLIDECKLVWNQGYDLLMFCSPNGFQVEDADGG